MKILYVVSSSHDTDLPHRLREHAPHIELETVATQNGAIARLTEGDTPPYDLVLTELRLPDGDGLSLLKYIRGRGLPLAVVVITAMGDEETAVAVIKAGADDYVAARKDYLARLPSTLESALHHHRARATRQSRPLKVLYAGHQDKDIDLTCRYVQQYAPHIQLDVVRNGTEVLQRLPQAGQARTYDVILLDYRLQEPDVPQLLKELGQEHTLDIPVVLLAEQCDEEMALEGLRLGAASYLVKNPGYIYQLPLELENACFRAELIHEKTALSESKARNRAMLEATPDLMFLQSRDGVYLDFHAKDPSQLRVPPEQFLGRNMREVLPPELAERFARCFEDIAQSGQAGLVEYSLPILGEDRHYEARVVNCDRDTVLSVVSDITKRKRAEAVNLNRAVLLADVNAALAEREGCLQSILQQCAEAVARRLDAAFARIWTLNHKERVLELQASAGLYTHLNGRHSRIPVGELKIGQIAEERKPHLTNDVCNDPRISDRQWAREQKMVAFAGYPLLVEDRVVGVMAMFARHKLAEDALEALATVAAPIAQGIERKRAEQALGESEQRFRSAFDYAAIGMALVAPDLRPIEVNRSLCELLGYSEQELLATDFQSLTHPGDVDSCLARVHRALAGETASFQLEKRYIHKRGHPVWVLMSASVLRDSGGKPLYLICQIQDITETKQAALNTQFINQLDFALSQIAGADEIIRLAATRLGEYLRATTCFVAEVNRAAGLATVREVWNGSLQDTPNIVGEYRISDYVTPEFRDEIQAGKAAVVNDVAADPRTRDFASKYEALGIAAYVSIPALNERQWEATLTVCDTHARDWRPDEIQLMRDITARLWPAVKRARALEALRESEQRFRQLAENIAAVFFITEEFSETSPGRVVYISPAFEKVWGRPRETIYQNTRSWLDAVHSEDRPRVSAALLSVAQARFDEEFRVVRPDGSIRWVHDRVFPIRNERGELYRLAGIVEDITARKQIEEALRESQLRYSLATTAGGVGVWDWNLETGAIYLDPMLKAVLGFEDREIENRIDDWGKRVHPEDVDHVMTEAQAHIDGLTPYYEVEHRMLHKDGSVRYFLARGAIVEGKNGNPRRMVGTDTDITARKRAEEALRESEQRARRTLVEQMLAGVAECDAAGRFVLVNQRFCDILGYTQAELREMGVNDITHPDDLPRMAELYRRLLETGESFVAEKRYLRKDGAEVWVNSNVSPIRNARGEVVESVAIVIDVTDRKRAEREREQLLKQEKAARAEAQAANRSKDEFLAVVSHELRSPLSSILGYARLLRTGTVAAAEIQRIAEIIERNGKIQLRLIEDLLDTARIISGKLKLEVQPVELVSVIAGALDVMRPAAHAKGIELRSQLEPLAGQLTGDPNRLQQIVWNLLSNAIKFTSRSGHVELRTENLPHQVRITVKDTGKGIEPEFLPFVFDRFRQSDSSSARRFGGLGLGLSLVKQLVELHGGTVEAASGGPGLGATFTVTLPQLAAQVETFSPQQPLAVAARESGTEGAIQPDQIPSLAGVRVLVVDDEQDTLSLVAATLRDSGAQVIAVASGAEALAILAAPPDAKRPDVLILDINMPDEDGYQTLERVRTLEIERGDAPSARIPAIALTALGRTEDRVKTLAAGFRMHVVKPVEPTELIMVVASLVERRAIGRGL
jgi:PAS domain S-box-containing protein